MLVRILHSQPNSQVVLTEDKFIDRMSSPAWMQLRLEQEIEPLRYATKTVSRQSKLLFFWGGGEGLLINQEVMG